MPELTREEKLKLVEKLPQQLQDLLYSEDTGAFLLYLGQKYNLPDEKVHLLSKLVADVVLGIVPITSLAQEINSKITSDAQAAMNLAQELYAELLAPAMVPAPLTPATPVPTAPAPTPATISPRPVAPPSSPVDRYREPTAGPEVVDLRNQPKAGPPRAEMPPAVSKVEPPPLPISSPTLSEQRNRGSSISQPRQGGGEIGTKPSTPPLTFTRPIEPPKPAAPIMPAPQPPLIEAEPHKIPTSTLKPQYIMRPSGLPPTDLPENVLDLRKDKGEF